MKVTNSEKTAIIPFKNNLLEKIPHRFSGSTSFKSSSFYKLIGRWNRKELHNRIQSAGEVFFYPCK